MITDPTYPEHETQLYPVPAGLRALSWVYRDHTTGEDFPFTASDVRHWCGDPEALLTDGYLIEDDAGYWLSSAAWEELNR